jgi:hypothetical protein
MTLPRRRWRRRGTAKPGPHHANLSVRRGNRHLEPEHSSGRPPAGGRDRSRCRRVEDEHRSPPATVAVRLVGGPHPNEAWPVAVELVLVEHLARRDAETPGADLNPRPGLGSEVERPGIGRPEPWMDVADDQTVVIAEVQQRHRPLEAGTTSRRRQEQDRSTSGERQAASGQLVEPSVDRREDTPDSENAESGASDSVSHAPEALTKVQGRHRTMMSTRSGHLARASPALVPAGDARTRCRMGARGPLASRVTA